MNGRKRRFGSRYYWLTLASLMVAGGFGAYEFFSVKADKPTYLFAPVDKGDIVLQVACTGTLAAVTTVQVGTQVSGTISELYADFNSQVKKGQILAKLDPSLFEAQAQQQEANVRAAEAGLNDDGAATASAKANLAKAKVDVLEKQRKLKMQQELWEESLIPRDDLDTAKAALEASVAAQQAQQAQIDSCEARFKADEQRLGQAQAALDQAKLNLQHTIITSPISGTIISRSIDVGQTVAASFSAPTLFVIGEDLTKMQVETNIDEADVGKIGAGMEATFTVDAYPGETFHGKISQVRLAPTTVQNVVTYTALIEVDNALLKLKPGMTANVKVLIARAEGVLRIPNSALRFRPDLADQEMEAAFRAVGEEQFYAQMKRAAARAQAAPDRGTPMSFASDGAPAAGGGRMDARPNPGRMPGAEPRGRRVPVWVMGEDKSLKPVVVRLGLTDGIQTELLPGSLTDGARIVTGVESGNSGRPESPAPMRAPGFGGPGMGGFGRRMR